MIRLPKKHAPNATDDAAPILIPDGTRERTFGDYLRHVAAHAGTIPATLGEFGRCVDCVRLRCFKLDA